MKIAVDLTSLADNFSGIERMALSITKELVKMRNGDYYQLFFKNEIYPEFKIYQECKNVECIVLPGREKLWFHQVTLLRAMAGADADVFLFLAFPPPFFLRKEKMIGTIHDVGCWDCPETMPGKMVAYFRIMNRNCVRRCRKVITISEFSKKRIQKHLKAAADKIQVIYLGVSSNMYEKQDGDWSEIKEKYQLPDQYIMCLSTLEPKKNMELLVEAYKELDASELKDCALVLAGRKGWKMEDFLQRAESMGENRICITGHVDEADLPALYNHARLFVFPSRYEGFGIPPLEAMASGCPVLCSDIEVLKEVLKDQAVYFCNNNKESLKQALTVCLSTEDDSGKRAERTAYSRNYCYEKTAAQVYSLLKDC